MATITSPIILDDTGINIKQSLDNIASKIHIGGIEELTGRVSVIENTRLPELEEEINNVDAKIPSITISPNEPTSSQGKNGDIWLVYETT